MATRKDAPTSAQANEDMFMHGLPTRVKQLETVVDSLHQDSIRTQGALQSLAGQVGQIAGSLKDLGDKLDIARTRKPDLGALATWAGVLILVGGMALQPTRATLSEHNVEIIRQQQVHLEDARAMGAFDARLDALEDREQRTWNTCLK